VHTSGTPRDVADDAMRALEAANRGQIATLVLPADVSWDDGGMFAYPRPIPVRPPVADAAVENTAKATEASEKTLLLLGSTALTEDGLRAASRIAAGTGARLLVETFPARLEEGAGLPAIDRLGYIAEAAQYQLSTVETLVLVGAAAPVSFFAYPGKASDLVPGGCAVVRLADPDQDVVDALERLADRVAPGVEPVLAELHTPEEVPAANLDVNNLAVAVAATLPANAIVVDEANTSGVSLPPALATAPRHSVLTLTGGAIGQGLPVATGAALAAPDRPVLSLQADGSAMYTIQALWTQVRENLNVTTVIFNNAAYAILRLELMRTGAGAAGERSAPMLDLSHPTTDFTALAQGMGMPAERVSTADGLAEALRRAYDAPGPHLIEAIIPPII
jgi:acetolactate synthase-1/2/3 large subunit